MRDQQQQEDTNLKKAILIVATLLTPVVFSLLSLRLSFTEPFLRIAYSITTFPEDGMSPKERLEIARLGLKSVLSHQGMKDFISSGLFNEREILHMQDVKNLLSKVFLLLYVLLPLWLLMVMSLKSRILIGKFLLFSSVFAKVVIIIPSLIAFIFFEEAFILLHLLFFDPYSWRFYEGDMLTRIYPMDFWFKAFLLLVVLYILLTSATGALGFFLVKVSNKT